MTISNKQLHWLKKIKEYFEHQKNSCYVPNGYTLDETLLSALICEA